MTKLLEQAMTKAQALPPEMQDEIARLVLLYAGDEDKRVVIQLTPEEGDVGRVSSSPVCGWVNVKPSATAEELAMSRKVPSIHFAGIYEGSYLMDSLSLILGDYPPARHHR